VSAGAIGLVTLLGIVAASFGYGLLALRLLEGGRTRLPGALVASGGLAILCWLGGWLAALELYSRGVSLALLAGGGAALALRAHDLRPLLAGVRRPPAAALALAALAAALFLVRTLGATRSPFVNPCDDWAAYFHLPKLLLETGGLTEPFSMRRLGVLGVGPFLQSFFLPGWATRGTAFADAALGGLVLWGAARAAVASAAGPAAPVRVEALGLLAGVASLAIPLANGSPVLLPMGGALVVLCLSAPLDRGCATQREEVARAVLWGAVAALLVGFRTSNVAFPGMVGLTGVAIALARRDGRALRRWMLAALAFVVALAPWSIASWRSSATPFFPVIRGHYQFETGLSAPLSAGDTLAFVASCLWANRVWYPLLLALALGRRPGSMGTALLTAASVLGTVTATALALTASDSFDVFRYCAPLVLPAIVYLGALWLGGLPANESAASPAAIRTRLALAALVTALWVGVPVQVETHSALDEGQGPKRFGSSPARGIARSANGWWFAARAALSNGLAEPPIAGAEDFAAAQASLGDDARVLAAVAKPFFWRFDRQVIHSVDCPGQASPPPGMPFFEGADALGRYLLDLGYTHLAFSPPRSDPCLYSRAVWTAAERSGVFLWEAWAPYFLDFLRNEQALATKLGTVYQSRDVIVVDLRRLRSG
jgi:hypothetical protein